MFAEQGSKAGWLQRWAGNQSGVAMRIGVKRDIYRSEIVPGHGDFASGWELWQIVAEGKNRTRLRYEAQLVLAFHMPPLIGPWILERELRRELIGTATRVEKLAGQ